MARIPINETVAKKLREIAESMGGGAVQVGFMEGSVEDNGMSIPTIAYLNEFGHGGHFPAPPRPFFRPMITAESPSWPGTMAGLAKSTNYNGTAVLNTMGEDIAGALVDSIRDVKEPALSPTTLALRAKVGNQPQNITLQDVLDAQRDVASGKAKLATGTQAKPLEWTGNMVRAVTYKVVK